MSKKNFMLLLLLSFLISSSAAQKQGEARIDSLIMLLKTDKPACDVPCLGDTNKVNHLLLLVSELRDGNPDSAMLLSNEALQLSEKINWQPGIGQSYHQIATFYGMKGEYKLSLQYYSKAIDVWERLEASAPENMQSKIKSQKSRSLGNIGMVYWRKGDYPKSLDYYFKALKMDEDLGNKNGVARHLGNIGNVYKSEGDFQKALDYELKALKIYEELGNKNGIATVQGNIGSLYTSTKKYIEAEKYLLSALASSDSIGDLYGVMEVNHNISELYSQTGRDKKSLEYYKKAMAAKDSLFNAEKDKEIIQNQMNYEFEKKEAAAKAEQEKKNAIAVQQIQKQKIIRNSFIGGFAIVLLFAGTSVVQRNRISKEKKRTEELLLNILPVEVADELKKTGHCLAKTYSMVTVMFADFKDFSSISEKVSAELLVDEINFCFSAFDNILQKHKVEKIKTVGDAYICASGLPVLNFTHAYDLTSAAIEIKNFMLAHQKEKEAKGEIPFEIRIGIHTGAVVAGIVGVKKFAYDIWGDTVNIAARMEQNSEAGKINISGATYELVKEKFNCTYRGKNRGEKQRND